MKPEQPAVSSKKTAAAAVRAGALSLVALVVLLPAPLNAAIDPDRDAPVRTDTWVGDNSFVWIDGTSADPRLELADAAQPQKPETREIAKPHEADQPPDGLSVLDRIQDWLARANR